MVFGMSPFLRIPIIVLILFMTVGFGCEIVTLKTGGSISLPCEMMCTAQNAIINEFQSPGRDGYGRDVLCP